MSTLMAVILYLVAFDGTARYNCNVRCVHFLSHMHLGSDKPRF